MDPPRASPVTLAPRETTTPCYRDSPPGQATPVARSHRWKILGHGTLWKLPSLGNKELDLWLLLLAWPALSGGVTSIDKSRLTKVIVSGTRARFLLLMFLQLKSHFFMWAKNYMNPPSYTGN